VPSRPPTEGGTVLAGKVALVTGGSRGIGRAICLELAGRGADVVVNFFRHGEAGRETAAAARARGGRAVAVRADVGKPAAVGALFEAARDTFGGVDILVCNAASGVFRPVLEIDARSWEWTMGTNAQAILWCAQQAVPQMEARGGGRIVTIGSPGAARALPAYAMTGASKGAVETLTRYLAVELAPRGIIVNGVTPGITPTDAWRTYRGGGAAGGAAVEAETIARTPLGRLVTPEDVAHAVAFLCTSLGIVGQTLVVDNGFGLAW
jgi:enoyl-[acyl-carrier protein] reductase III